jgi:hypothetical protein
MVYATERIVVPFTGEGAGDEPLSWGQQELWLVMARQKTWMPMGGTKALTPDTTVDDIAAELSYLVSRHQTFRTRLRFDDDGQRRQVVWDSGETWLDIIDAGDADPDEVAEFVRLRYWETDFDYLNDWPIRMSVVRQHGVLTHHVTVVCHISVDASGAAVMLADVADRNDEPIVGMQGLEQARWQNSPAGLRQHASAMRHWEKGLRRIPVPKPTALTDRREPRHWQGQCESKAMYLAVWSIAERTGADSGHVLMALYAASFGRHMGLSPVALRPVVNNRFRRDLADVVGFMTQSGLSVIDVADASFEEVLDRVQRTTMAVYKNAYFDPIGLEELIDTIAAERGPVVDLACFFNDRRTTTRTFPAGPAPTAEQIRAALPETDLRWNHSQDDPIETVFLHFDEAPEAMSLLFQVDTHCMSVRDMQACVQAMEEIAVEVACAPAEVGSP